MEGERDRMTKALWAARWKFVVDAVEPTDWLRKEPGSLYPWGMGRYTAGSMRQEVKVAR